MLFGVFVGIRWYSKVETPKGRSTVQEPRPIQAANALDMVRDVKANEVAFESAWEGKRPKITGRVVDVQASVNDGRLLLGKGYTFIQAEDLPKSSLVHIQKGDTVTVLCDHVSEVIGSVVASDCRLQR